MYLCRDFHHLCANIDSGVGAGKGLRGVGQTEGHLGYEKVVTKLGRRRRRRRISYALPIGGMNMRI